MTEENKSGSSTRTSRTSRTSRIRKAKGNYKPGVGQWRIDLVKNLIFVAAITLVVSDGVISWMGLTKVAMGDMVAIVLTTLIFVTQLGVGILHALGVNFRDLMVDSGDDWGNTFWVYVLLGIYFLDIASNMIAMQLIESVVLIADDVIGGIGGVFLAVAGGTLLTFADEMLFRLHDKIAIESKSNKVLSERMKIEQQLHNVYLKEVKSLGREKAKAEAQNEGGNWTFGDHL